MTDLYNVVKDGKVIKTGTQDECEYFATWNAQHGKVVKAD